MLINLDRVAKRKLRIGDVVIGLDQYEGEFYFQVVKCKEGLRLLRLDDFFLESVISPSYVAKDVETVFDVRVIEIIPEEELELRRL